MLVAIGCPNGNNGNNEMMGVMAVFAHELGRTGHMFAYLGRCSPSIDLNRNQIMQAAKDLAADYLLMMDTDIDIKIEGGIMTHLISMNKDIVSGVVYQGVFPFRPMIYNFSDSGVANWSNIPKEPFKCEAAGGGFLFISKKVIDHFTYDKPGEAPFDYIYSPLFLREDVAFCYRCKQAGFELWVEPRIKIDHWKRQAIGENHWTVAKQHILASQPINSIDGFMSETELRFLRDKAAEMGSIVEIGSWKGRSTKELLEYCKGTVTAVDHWQGSDTIKETAKNNDIHAEFMKNVGHYPNLKVMKMASLEAAASLNGDMFDMVFIDGSHDYDNVRADIEAWLPRARKLLCGHDYTNAWPGVVRAVSERFGKVKTVDSIWYVELRGNNG